MTGVLFFISICILVYFTFLGLWYSLLLILSFPEVIKKFREVTLGDISLFIDQLTQIPITIVTPAFNEQHRILSMLYSGLNSNYKNVRFIVVNDGSTDKTMEILIDEFQLYEIPTVIKQTIPTCKVRHCFQSARFPNLMVIDKEHSPYHCAADSVNVGLNACQTPIMLTVDADTVLEPEALTRMMFSFLSKGHCIVVSGSVYVLNENKVQNGRLLTTDLPKRFVPAVQGLEYLRSFLYGRAGLNVLGGAMCYPGAFTLFETQSLREVGGYDSQNFSYDAEITLKLHRYMIKNRFPHSLNHSPNAFCWTEVPSTAKSFWNQRDKWQRGMWRSAMKFITMFGNPRYGIVGLISFPAFVLFEILGPVVEFCSYCTFIIAYFIGDIDYQVIFWFLVMAWGYLAYITVAMIFLNLITFNKYHRMKDVFRSIWLILAEMLWFREFRAACCARGTLRYFVNRLLGKPL
ncbi:glycosyltransferase family 2 protein [Legionella quinlivanii]|uniref:glycosyltransferase family 2 protein n=1 Tax=Legionella quinlivanii TaxID=45073 RepID=UPI0022444DB1|nr:glycosyltransferase [Legionella quinlivanii]MCW8452415.1 glycosyltransferase [Legionella quinlivanii]